MSSTTDLRAAPWQAGMVVLASVMNPRENPYCTGKIRPAVLVERVDGHWRVMGLTSKPRYDSGQSRVAVPSPFRVGLHGPGYLWSPRLVPVCSLDLERPIGWCDSALADAVADLARLPYFLRRELRRAADQWNPTLPIAA